MCWLIIRKARVRAPIQTSKWNTKCIPSAITSQQISGNFIYSQSFCQKFAEMKWPNKFFSLFGFIWSSNRGLTSSKPTRSILSYGDFWKQNIPTQLAITTLQSGLRTSFSHNTITQIVRHVKLLYGRQCKELCKFRI